MKKLLVNAQATAIISAVEGLGSLLVGMITLIAGTGTLGLSRLNFHIILPYLYLKNTRENREQIIQVGWRKAIQNCFNIKIPIIYYFIFQSFFSWKRPNATVANNAVAHANENDIYVISRNAEENDEDLEIYLNEIPNATIQNMKDCKLF